jgi:hypothetical protein
MLRKLANTGLIFFLIASGLFTVLYVFAFIDKIIHPHYKNLSMRDYSWLGLIVIGLLIIDYFIVKRFIRELRKDR